MFFLYFLSPVYFLSLYHLSRDILTILFGPTTESGQIKFKNNNYNNGPICLIFIHTLLDLKRNVPA